MATITEDYVSFETSKLLKEKGFNIKCDKCYAYFADDDIRFLDLKYPKLAQLLIENRYPCITLQMAMKWLRKEHNLYINAYPDANGEGLFYPNIYKLNDDDWEMLFCEEIEHKFFTTPEEATEAAIKYCLENLI